MNHNELRILSPGLSLREGSDVVAIQEAERGLGYSFPDDYKSFLRCSNGATGPVIGDRSSYVNLWRVEELEELNHGYMFPTLCPEVVAFGSNGGGEAFAFRRDTSRIVMVPFIGVEMDTALDVADSFIEFLARPLPKEWK